MTWFSSFPQARHVSRPKFFRSFDSATAYVGLSSIHIEMLKFFGNMMNKDEQPRTASFKDHKAGPKDK